MNVRADDKIEAFRWPPLLSKLMSCESREVMQENQNRHESEIVKLGYPFAPGNPGGSGGNVPEFEGDFGEEP